MCVCVCVCVCVCLCVRAGFGRDNIPFCYLKILTGKFWNVKINEIFRSFKYVWTLSITSKCEINYALKPLFDF